MSNNILIIYWDLDLGGIQTLIKDIILYADRKLKNHKLILLLKNDKTGNARRHQTLLKNVKIIIYSQSRFKKLGGAGFIFWLILNLFKFNPRTVSVYSDKLSVLFLMIKKIFWFNKSKIIINEHIYLSEYIKLYRNKIWKLLIKSLYCYPNLILVTTQACKADLINRFQIKQVQIKAIANWTLVKPLKEVKKYDLIYAGRFDPEKNIEKLINNINLLKKILPDIKLCLVGNGICKNRIACLISELGLNKNIVVLDYTPGIIKLLSSTKIYISASQIEGMPISILEANKCGLPAVIYNYLGAVELVKNGHNGYVVDDDNEFIECVSRLLTNKKLYMSLSAESQRIVSQKFNIYNLKTLINQLT